MMTGGKVTSHVDCLVAGLGLGFVSSGRDGGAWHKVADAEGSPVVAFAGLRAARLMNVKRVVFGMWERCVCCLVVTCE